MSENSSRLALRAPGKGVGDGTVLFLLTTRCRCHDVKSQAGREAWRENLGNPCG
jgi:hypothetical protein